MGKFILTESEKESILNLYREKNIIAEQSETPKELPYGLKYNPSSFEIINFNEVFGFDVQSAKYSPPPTEYITIFTLGDVFRIEIFDLDEVPFEKVKNIVSKLNNNDFPYSEVEPKLNSKDEEILSSLFNNKISNFVFDKNQLEMFRYFKILGNHTTFAVPFVPTTNNEILYVVFYDRPRPRFWVYLKNGKSLLSWHDEYSLSSDNTGNLSLNFGRIESEIQGGPLTTKTKKRVSQSTLQDGNFESLINGGEFSQIGDRGNLIKSLQNILLKIGQDNFNITKDKEGCKVDMEKCDGIFGKGTKNALMKFQSENNLKSDGILGPSTAQALQTRVWSF